MSDMPDDESVSIHAGFPNPAADRSLQGLDLHKLVVKNTTSTFFMRVEGNTWEERSIFDNDIVVIDRAADPRKTDLVVATKDDGFLLTMASELPEDSLFWGTVTAVVRRYRP